MNVKKIAITIDDYNGLDSTVSGHFGHCTSFIIATISEGEIIEMVNVANPAHSSCDEPVNRLVGCGVNILITMGIGMRPYMATREAGLTVIQSNGGTVQGAINDYINGQSELMNQEGICRGGNPHNQ